MCKGYYSPRIREDLVKKLYFKRKQMKITMVNLVNEIVEDWFDRTELKGVFNEREKT